MNTSVDVQEKIKELLSDISVKSIPADKIKGSSDIMNEVGLDSIQMIAFILTLEDVFEVEIDFETLDAETLSTVDNLCGYIGGLLNSKAG